MPAGSEAVSRVRAAKLLPTQSHRHGGLWLLYPRIYFADVPKGRVHELLSLAKYRDGGRLFCRSGFTPDMRRKDVGDKPRPTSEFRHSIVRGSVMCVLSSAELQPAIYVMKRGLRHRATSVVVPAAGRVAFGYFVMKDVLGRPLRYPRELALNPIVIVVPLLTVIETCEFLVSFDRVKADCGMQFAQTDRT